MFEITFRELRDANFHQAIERVGASKGYGSTKAAYKVAKLLKDIGKESEICEKLFVEKVNGFGAVIKGNQFKIPDDKIEDWSKSVDEFLDTVVEVKHDKLKLEELGQADLSPRDLAAIDSVLEVTE